MPDNKIAILLENPTNQKTEQPKDLSQMNSTRLLLALITLAAILPISGCVTDNAIQKVARPVQQPSRRDGFAADPSTLERSLHQRIDKYRRSQGLAPLAFNSKTADLARAHSQNMANSGSLNHNGRSNRIAQLRQSGFSTVTENVTVSRNETDVTRAMLRNWIQSPQNQNLTNPSDKQAGVGVAQAPDGTWYGTALFDR